MGTTAWVYRCQLPSERKDQIPNYSIVLQAVGSLFDKITPCVCCFQNSSCSFPGRVFQSTSGSTPCKSIIISRNSHFPISKQALKTGMFPPAQLHGIPELLPKTELDSVKQIKMLLLIYDILINNIYTYSIYTYSVIFST